MKESANTVKKVFLENAASMELDLNEVTKSISNTICYVLKDPQHIESYLTGETGNDPSLTTSPASDSFPCAS